MPVSAIKSINHAVCLSLVGTYNGSYFGVEKNSFCLCLSSMSVLENVKLGGTLRESGAYPEQFCIEKSMFTA